MTPIRWGILGASKFAKDHMAPAIHLARGAVLAAVASRSSDKVAPFQAMAPDCRAIASYEALIQDLDIDAVYIPLPHHLHVEWAIKALHAGKHVLVEKPIAMHGGDFAALIAARDASGLLAAEAYMIVHHPQWQRARKMVADGAIARSYTSLAGSLTTTAVIRVIFATSPKWGVGACAILESIPLDPHAISWA